MDWFEILIKNVAIPILTAIVGWLIATIKKWKVAHEKEEAMKKKMEEQNQHLIAVTQDGMKCLLRRTIKEDCEEYLNKGYCTQEEREELEEAFNLYTAFGGNHTIPQYVERIRNLPFRPHH